LDATVFVPEGPREDSFPTAVGFIFFLIVLICEVSISSVAADVFVVFAGKTFAWAEVAGVSVVGACAMGDGDTDLDPDLVGESSAVSFCFFLDIFLGRGASTSLLVEALFVNVEDSGSWSSMATSDLGRFFNFVAAGISSVTGLVAAVAAAPVADCVVLFTSRGPSATATSLFFSFTPGAPAAALTDVEPTPLSAVLMASASEW
jgi:hypothetical protein